ncbi:MAG: hypothetical protein ABIN89_12995 [Chitinophagaceae bacterium]
MGNFTVFIVESLSESSLDTLRIDSKKGKVEGQFDTIKYVDKETMQIVVYIPSVEVSGYGETYEKAAEMLKFNLNEFFEYLTNLSTF